MPPCMSKICGWQQKKRYQLGRLGTFIAQNSMFSVAIHESQIYTKLTLVGLSFRRSVIPLWAVDIDDPHRLQSSIIREMEAIKCPP